MTNYLSNFNVGYIEQLLQQYKQDANAVDPSWRYFFDGMSVQASGVQHKPVQGGISQEELDYEIKAMSLIQGYRELAYLIADVDPLDRRPKTHPLLALENFGLTEADLDRTTHIGKILGLGTVTLRKIIETLESYYCTPIAVELAHIEEPASRNWVIERVETRQLKRPLEQKWKRRALEMLTKAECIERFIHKKFVGQKRFSLEGCDVLIPMLDYIVDKFASLGADEFIVGMAHRGRLSVLANIFNKDLHKMFAEFTGSLEMGGEQSQGDGDVKYHMGYSLDTQTFSGHNVHISLAPNPSHLEAVNSVVMGITHAKQQVKKDRDKTRTVLILLHGDASFAGQGSVYELLNMSQLQGYSIGGAVHIIVNNQIGFTTDSQDARSTKHATDVCKMLQIPIFRVNADETEAALRTADIAVSYRNEFKRDVVIDLVGYRRYGHNEGDEPTFTQPLMYHVIDSHPTARQIYSGQLLKEGAISKEEADSLIEIQYAEYEKYLEKARQEKISPKMEAFSKRWTSFTNVPFGEEFFKIVDTKVSKELLKNISSQLFVIPDGFNLHKKLQKVFQERRELLESKSGIDWAWAESLAFTTLTMEGHAVRLAGQDCKRGTFSHRHAVLFDTDTGKQHVPVSHVKETRAEFEVINSLLSEYGALGFEFGESLANPNQLTLWEAQFGDFVNGAQIITDQFITCSAFKWQRFSGLVMLLPHGYEGQGPEHSSGRVERFLQACAQHNIQVCNLSTPAQYFHVLRRQMKREYRLPLIIMTPKSMLRSPLAVSSWENFSDDHFHEFFDEVDPQVRSKARRVVFCSGKIYYELLKKRQDLDRRDIAIVRVEQFYPFNRNLMVQILASYANCEDWVWCQEEPQNMGGWTFIRHFLEPIVPSARLRYVGRRPQASTANGYMAFHLIDQEQILKEAMAL